MKTYGLKKRLFVFLIAVMMMSMVCLPAYAASAPAADQVGVYAEDVRIEANSTAEITYTVLYGANYTGFSSFAGTLNFDTAKMAFDKPYTATGMVASIDPGYLTGASTVDTALTAGTGTEYTITYYFKDVNATNTPTMNVRKVGLTPKINYIAQTPAGGYDVEDPTIIVQYPVTVTIEGTLPTGASVKANATAYATGKNTYNSAGAATTIASGDKIWVDSGEGQQNTPILNITAPAGYKAQYKIGTGSYADAVANQSVGAITGDTSVSVMFVKTNTSVAVSVAPTEGGDITQAGVSVAGKDVEFSAGNLVKQFKITPSEGYSISDVLYDGTSVKEQVSSAGYYTLTMTAAEIAAETQEQEHTLAVTFLKNSYDVKAQVAGNSGGTVQYNGTDVVDAKFHVDYTTSPVSVAFVPTDNTYEVEKVEVTTDGGVTWSEVTKADSYTFQNGITDNLQGVRVTFKSKINEIIVPGTELGGEQIVILRGAWAKDDPPYTATVKINGQIVAPEDMAENVTWSVVDGFYGTATNAVAGKDAQGNDLMGFGFVSSSLDDADIASVNASGLVTALKSGIVRVRATSTIDTTKYADIIVIIPGDYDRSGVVDVDDASSIVEVSFNRQPLMNKLYAKELADIDKSTELDVDDASVIVDMVFDRIPSN